MYLSHPPPSRAPPWPVGTILVKESQTFGLHAGITIDAMVKRGGGFNFDVPGGLVDGGLAVGAHDWEWMGLNRIGDAGATIGLARAQRLPPNAGYGPLNGDCNACHTQAVGNDAVQCPTDDAGFQASAPLRLSSTY